MSTDESVYTLEHMRRCIVARTNALPWAAGAVQAFLAILEGCSHHIMY